MLTAAILDPLSQITMASLHSPFEWCSVPAGQVILQDASSYGGTPGGIYRVDEFAIAKYIITNAQYERFLTHPGGFSDPCWWGFSTAAVQWRKDHPKPKPTAFPGADLPRTRVSWFDSMAFCSWLSAELKNRMQSDGLPGIKEIIVRLPTEQEWQRAALGDTGWCYPWGDELEQGRGNYADHVGQASSVGNYPEGKSLYGVLDMIGNLWEWCLTGWGQETLDLDGYTYRVIKGGAWNISNPDHLRANDRGCHPPRGRLNDCGFRVSLHYG